MGRIRSRPIEQQEKIISFRRDYWTTRTLRIKENSLDMKKHAYKFKKIYILYSIYKCKLQMEILNSSFDKNFEIYACPECPQKNSGSGYTACLILMESGENGREGNWKNVKTKKYEVDKYFSVEI